MKKHILIGVLFAGLFALAAGPTSTRELRTARIKNGSATTAFPSTTNGTVATLARTESLYNKTLDSTSSAPAALISSGTFAYARLGTLNASILGAGTLNTAQIGTYIGSLAAAQVDSGTLAYARLGVLSGSLLGSDIAASQIGSGTLASARIGTYIGSVAGSQVDSGTLAIARLGTIPKSSVSTSGTFAIADIPAFNSLHPMTTTGDMIYSSSGVTSSRLALGSSGQVLKVVGSAPTWATFSGGINYASSNPDFESDTTGWVTYDDAAATPVDLVDGTVTLTNARTTSTPLRGSGSALITNGSIGEGVAFTITPDVADYGNMVEISFDYSFVTATGATGDYTVWVYDTTNNQLLQPAGYSIQGGVVGTPLKHKATFQASTSGVTYRVAIHQTTDTTADLKFDNVEIGPPKKSQGPAMTDWTTYAMSITGSTSNPSLGTNTQLAQWRRVGDSMQIRYYLAQTSAGSLGSGSYLFSLPSGYSIDTNKLTVDSSGRNNAVGEFSGYISSAPNYFATGTVFAYNSTNLALIGTISNTTPSIIAPSIVGSTALGLSNTNISYAFEATVPISGWSSNVIMGNDSPEGRVVAFRAVATSGTQGAAFANVTTWTAQTDTHAGLSSSTTYTIPVSGVYSYAVQIASGNVTANSIQGVKVLKNGSTTLGINYQEGIISTLYPATNVSGVASFNAGDTVTVHSSNNQNYALHTTDGYNTFSLNRLSGNNAVAASETVSATANFAATASSGSYATMDITSAGEDSHGGISTSGETYTIPISGRYIIGGYYAWGSDTYGGGDQLFLGYSIDGGSDQTMAVTGMSAITWAAYLTGTSSPVRLTAGQVVRWRMANSTASAPNTTTASKGWIYRIGNY